MVPASKPTPPSIIKDIIRIINNIVRYCANTVKHKVNHEVNHATDILNDNDTIYDDLNEELRDPVVLHNTLNKKSRSKETKPMSEMFEVTKFYLTQTGNPIVEPRNPSMWYYGSCQVRCSGIILNNIKLKVGVKKDENHKPIPGPDGKPQYVAFITVPTTKNARTGERYPIFRPENADQRKALTDVVLAAYRAAKAGTEFKPAIAMDAPASL